jgi:hypothetical protein
MSIILGVDPGVHGAIALLDEGGDLLEVLDMPSTTEANGRTATNAPLLAGLLARTHARIAFCEFVGPRATVAKVAAFAFGDRSWCHRGLRRRPGLADRVPDATRMERAGRDSAWPHKDLRAPAQSPAGGLAPTSLPASATLTAPKPAGSHSPA